MSLWPFVTLLVLWRVDAWVTDWLAMQRPAVPERPAALIPLPADIEARAQQESMAWAQDDVRTAARERFEALAHSALTDDQRWNLVRRALGLGAVE